MKLNKELQKRIQTRKIFKNRNRAERYFIDHYDVHLMVILPESNNINNTNRTDYVHNRRYLNNETSDKKIKTAIQLFIVEMKI